MAKRYELFKNAFVHGNVDVILLSEIEEAKATHGYQIITNIREEYKVYLGPSTVYPALTYLEEHGLIKHHWDLGNGKPRKVFMLTPKGKQMVRHQRMAIRLILEKLERKAKGEA